METKLKRIAWYMRLIQHARYGDWWNIFYYVQGLFVR